MTGDSEIKMAKGKFFRLMEFWKKLFPQNSYSHECNICGWNGKKFVPMVNPATGEGRDAARCPGCGSVERHRGLMFYLESSVCIKPGQVVLDFTPMPGFKEFFKDKKKAVYFGSDYFVRKELQCDITKLPLKEQSADLIICYHILEHVKDDASALSEMFRILKMDGKLILQVPYREDLEFTVEYESPDGMCHDHVRDYGLDVVKRINESGFIVEALDFSRTASRDTASRNGFLQCCGTTFICSKE